ncbi:metallophosphoesterase family protein [Methylobacterium sp. NEAU 140]|uniref:metallophosphoesterase family protein n=1 Tax=Methylobacterium sp. NEAU 140 TaxID=3064945 RepID=UPI002732F864|nr:metallophosphoesterase family protein [Methylobacterium sp. NEAU 140]MDP4025661.1 metallophosphoesterase family protein [Methylobacterium sp. NEAU 140]
MEPGTLTYAVGDIHGRADLLDALLERIAAHAAGRDRRLVFLGDYIDRGPDSAAVLRTVSRLAWAEPERVTCLMGNHERMLLDALVRDGAAGHWLINGGEATLAAFGARDAAGLPRDTLDWIEALPTLHGDAARWYVHAGFRPGVAPPDSEPHDRLWIREPFLDGDHDFGRHVVHGHTPRQDGRPEVRRFRTNLDTGAVYGGPLTAGVFSDARGPALDFLQVRG